MTQEKYDALLAAQGGTCAICQLPATTYHVDHDHTCCPQRMRSCGACVRGLLCSNCNVGIGQFKENPERLMRAATYLSMACAWIAAIDESNAVFDAITQ